ncbi:FAD-binding oxidoreductase [Thermogutta sp.]|uniref:FAD-binding oxidoreductase n=1 Tax=Thermogutta sp. TaxID=1962930 RepID=UPI003C7A3535
MISLSKSLAHDWLPIEAVQELGTYQEVSEVLREASRRASAVYTLGSGLRARWGSRPEKLGLGISCASMNRIIDYQPTELTLTAEAGITLAELEATLSASRQWVPGLSGLPGDLQLGGLLAAPFPRPRDWRWGRLAEAVLGLEVVTGEGTHLVLGGAVVKNAAGYRLLRLFLGSWGSLGVITRATLLTRPRPEGTEILTVGMKRATFCETFLQQLAALPLPCLSDVIMCDHRCLTDSDVDLTEELGRRWVMATFLLEGDKLEVDLAKDALGSLADRQNWKVVSISAVSDQALEREVVTCGHAVCQISGVPEQMPMITTHVQELFPGARWWGYLFSGQVLVVDTAREFTVEKIQALRTKMEAEGARVAVLRTPEGTNWPPSVLWGPPHPRHVYAQRWKDICDPAHILNPGRYVFA